MPTFDALCAAERHGLNAGLGPLAVRLPAICEMSVVELHGFGPAKLARSSPHSGCKGSGVSANAAAAFGWRADREPCLKRGGAVPPAPGLAGPGADFPVFHAASLGKPIGSCAPCTREAAASIRNFPGWRSRFGAWAKKANGRPQQIAAVPGAPASMSRMDLEGLPLIKLPEKAPFARPPKAAAESPAATADDVMTMELCIREKTQ